MTIYGRNPWAPYTNQEDRMGRFNYGPDSFWNTEDPGVAETVFQDFVNTAPSQNMRDYFGKQFKDFFNRYNASLADVYAAGGDTTQMTLGGFLQSQPFGSTFANLPPDVAGRRQGQIAPLTRFAYR